MSIALNTFATKIDKDEWAATLKDLRATEPKPYRDFVVKDEAGNVILDMNSEATVVVTGHFATGVKDNKLVVPDDKATQFGCGSIVNADMRYATTAHRFLYLWAQKAWTHTPANVVEEMGDDGVIDYASYLDASERAEGGTRKPSVFRNPAFVELLVQELHEAGKTTTNTGDELDSAYLLGLEAAVLRKAFTAKGAPWQNVYAKALARYTEGQEQPTAEADIL